MRKSPILKTLCTRMVEIDRLNDLTTVAQAKLIVTPPYGHRQFILTSTAGGRVRFDICDTYRDQTFTFYESNIAVLRDVLLKHLPVTTDKELAQARQIRQLKEELKAAQSE